MDAREVEQLMLSVANAGDVDGGTLDLDSWDEWDDILDYRDHAVDVPGLGRVSQAEFDTGGEGHGENIYMVFKVELNAENSVNMHVPDTKYYRVDGYYRSYDGSEWDGKLYEVKPVQRMVTFYEKTGE